MSASVILSMRDRLAALRDDRGSGASRVGDASLTST
jgi:hypothetical protein